MYEIAGRGVRRFLIAPFAGTLPISVTVVSLVLPAEDGRFLIVALLWSAWVGWRASKVRLRADASGITVVNLFRS